MRLLIVQYAGDYLAAYRRLHETQTETYFAHGYVLEQLGNIAGAVGETAILCGHTDSDYEERLPSGLIVMGTRFDPARQHKRIEPLLEHFGPTHLVVLGPLGAIIRWGARTNKRILCVFADSFEIGPLRRLFRYGRLAALLGDSHVAWVANHGINACLSLARLGVDRERIIPWDFPHLRRPAESSPKAAEPSGTRRLLFVGALIRSKGIGDAISALAELRKRGHAVELDVVGGGDLARFRGQARRIGILDQIKFHGVLANSAVFEMMRGAFAVLVPSRYSYPEGLPFTIYEALSARTPIVASDHPMFRHNLEHRKTAMVFQAGKAVDLADQVEQLLCEPALYASLSEASERAWENIQIGTKWGDMLHRWVADTPNDREWLRSRHLAAHLYRTVVQKRTLEA